MIVAPAINIAGSLKINNLDIFSNIEIEVGAAQWTCLLGASGVGKSTILRLFLGLETGGVFNGDIKASDGQILDGRIGYMAQSDLLLPWLNIIHNVIIGAKLRGQAADLARANQLISRVGLTDHKAKFPNQLSGGMRQRVALARVLMEDRPIILLDEPFSALDASTRADMQELSAEMLKDKTVLLVTHDPAEAARMGHKIIVMSATEAKIWNVPKSVPTRNIDATETIACQSSLLNHLRNSKTIAIDETMQNGSTR